MELKNVMKYIFLDSILFIKKIYNALFFRNNVNYTEKLYLKDLIN